MFFHSHATARLSKAALLFAVCSSLAIGWRYGRTRHSNDPAPPLKGFIDTPPPGVLVALDSGKRSNVFYVGEPISFKLDNPAARYEVRNYRAEVVDSGPTRDRINLKTQPPGWYKLYIYGVINRGEPWGDAVGGTTFVVFRNDSRFPALPSRDIAGGSEASEDEPMRGVIGMGPQRLRVEDAGKPDEAIAKIAIDVALDKKYYLPFDPARKRVLMVAFPNGTKGKENGVRRIAERFKNDIRYWEPRNEPNFGTGGSDFAINEMKPFYQTIKSVSPNLQVMGPGTVSLNADMQNWLDDFFKAGGGKFIDVFSFHAYNNVNGDVWLARKSLNTTVALLAKYGLRDIEKWQTEQGNFAAMYGVYAPAHQARWTMTQMMTFEQYGIPKEHNHLWYDRSHGFWGVPAWWINDDGSLNPEAATMRVYAEELYGTNFKKALDFGSGGNGVFIGNLFSGTDKLGGNKNVMAMMSAGATDATVQLRVTGAKTLRVVSAWGVTSDIPVVSGIATVAVPELPVYVESSTRTNVQIVPQNWGANLARQAGVRISASQQTDKDGKSDGDNDIRKVVNGVQESWYWDQKAPSTPWNAFDPKFPMTVDIQLPAPATVHRVLVYAAPPWSYQATLLNFDVQVDQNGAWKTVAQVREPTRTWKVYTPTTRTSVDSFHSDRWIFPTVFAPVRTSKIRLLVRDSTYGGGATDFVDIAGGQAWNKRNVMLREVEIYGK